MTAYEKIVMLPPNVSKIFYFPLQGSNQLVRTGTIGDGSCFGLNTRVYTQDGVKNIQDVKIGDKLVSHSGNVNTVTHTFKNPVNNRKVLELDIYKTPSITVTEDHRFYTITRNDPIPKWVEVKELSKEHFVLIPKNNDTASESRKIDIIDYTDPNTEQYEYEYMLEEETVNRVTKYTSQITNPYSGDIHTTKICKKGSTCNRYWNVDEDFCELLGIWYGNGCIVYRDLKHHVSPRGISFTSSKNNTEIIDFITNTGTRILGIEPVINRHKNQNLVTIAFNNALIGCVFKNIFGHGFDGKNLPKFLYNCSTACKKAFVSGLISTDGCVDSKLNVSLSLTNTELIEEVYHLTRSIGIASSVSYRDNDNGKLTGYMRFDGYHLDRSRIKKYYTDNRLDMLKNNHPDYTKNHSCIVMDGNTFLQVQDKREVEYNNDYVYTLEIENDHSYAVEGVVVENCMFHALFHAFSSDYVHMKEDKKMELVSKLRTSMAKKVDKDRWKNMNDGMIAMVSFQEIVNKLIANFYKVVEKGKGINKIKSVSLKEVVDHILVNNNTRAIYSSLIEIIPLKTVTGGGGILETSYRGCNDIDSCKESVLKYSEQVLTKKLERGGLEPERTMFFVEKFKMMIRCILNEAESSAYTKYIRNLENSETFIDQTQIDLISDKFNFDIYFINGDNRLPYLTGCHKDTYKKRKSVILLWIGENHYEVVGRVIKGTKKVERQFEHDDPLIQILYTLYCNPKKFSKKYPQFTQYLPASFRKDFGLDSTNVMDTSDEDSEVEDRDSDYNDVDDDDSDVYSDD